MSKCLRFLASLLLVFAFAVFSMPQSTLAAASYEVKALDNSLSGGTPLNTGIAVSPGQLLTISVSPEDTWKAGEVGRTSNANGLGNPLGDDFGVFEDGDFGFLYGSLIGTLDGGKTYFPVGTKLDMTVLNSGELSLLYWDSNTEGNSDSVTAVVQVYEGPNLN